MNLCKTRLDFQARAFQGVSDVDSRELKTVRSETSLREPSAFTELLKNILEQEDGTGGSPGDQLLKVFIIFNPGP